MFIVEGAEAAVTEALEAAAKGEQKTESPTVEAKVAEVKSEEVKISETAPVKPSDSTEVKDKGPVPYDRFSQVIAEKNTLAKEKETLDERVKTAGEREDNLRTRLTDLEKEKAILDSVRGAANDPKMKGHIEAIDKYIQGIEDVEEQVDKGEVTEEAAAKKLEQLVGKAETKVDEFLTEQRSKELWESTDSMASSMLESLPEEYTDQDRRDLGEKWTSRVDWKTIDEKGQDSITPVLKESFTALIKEYGEPRGAMAKRIKDEVLETVPEKDRPMSDEDAVKGILAKDWGALDDKGKAVHSEAEFTDNVAQLLRKTSGA